MSTNLLLLLLAVFSGPAQVKEYQLGRNSREIASAENIRWTERAYGKTLVYSHNGHLVRTAGTGGDDNGSVSFGVLLNDLYQKDYVLIVSDIDHYTDRAARPPAWRITANSVPGISSCLTS